MIADPMLYLLLRIINMSSDSSRARRVEYLTAADIEADQRRARLDDANASTRPNTVTMDELKKGGGRK